MKEKTITYFDPEFAIQRKKQQEQKKEDLSIKPIHVYDPVHYKAKKEYLKKKEEAEKL